MRNPLCSGLMVLTNYSASRASPGNARVVHPSARNALIGRLYKRERERKRTGENKKVIPRRWLARPERRMGFCWQIESYRAVRCFVIVLMIASMILGADSHFSPKFILLHFRLSIDNSNLNVIKTSYCMS